MLRQLQQTAILLFFAFLAGLMWIFPVSKVISERAAFHQLWWSAVDTPLRINFLDSLTIASLPLPNTARSAFHFRRTRKWPIKNLEELSALPGMDSIWVRQGVFDFSYVSKAPGSPKTAFPKPNHNPKAPVDLAPPLRIDINAADSLALVSVPGIGPWGARAILRERERWGHIQSLNQLKDKFPFDRHWDTSWAQSLVVEPQSPPWSLNASSFDSLLKVPAFNYHQVKKIAFYRESFGRIQWSEIEQWGWWTKEEIHFFKLYITE